MAKGLIGQMDAGQVMFDPTQQEIVPGHDRLANERAFFLSQQNPGFVGIDIALVWNHDDARHLTGEVLVHQGKKSVALLLTRGA